MTEARLRIAIIGSTGRGADGARLTAAHWRGMRADAAARVDQLATAAGLSPGEVELVSGGAAWADHVAVSLFEAGVVGGLALHLPAKLDAHGFVEDAAAGTADVGVSVNGFHRQFERRTGIDSLAQLAAAPAAGAAVTVWPGRLARNTAVASRADMVLAYTFGDGLAATVVAPDAPGFADPHSAGVGEGGTADTWRKATGARLKIHVPFAACVSERAEG